MPPKKELKPCADGKVRNPKTNRCIKQKVQKQKNEEVQEWTQQIQKEFRQILEDLRKPKLAGMFTQRNKQDLCPKCIKDASTQQLQKQLNGRKNPVPVNILVPKKKKKQG